MPSNCYPKNSGEDDSPRSLKTRERGAVSLVRRRIKPICFQRHTHTPGYVADSRDFIDRARRKLLILKEEREKLFDTLNAPL